MSSRSAARRHTETQGPTAVPIHTCGAPARSSKNWIRASASGSCSSPRAGASPCRSGQSLRTSNASLWFAWQAPASAWNRARRRSSATSSDGARSSSEPLSCASGWPESGASELAKRPAPTLRRLGAFRIADAAVVLFAVLNRPISARVRRKSPPTIRSPSAPLAGILALSAPRGLLVHTREVAGSKPAAPTRDSRFRSESRGGPSANWCQNPALREGLQPGPVLLEKRIACA